MIVNTKPAIASGTQPPSSILMMFAEKNPMSMTRNARVADRDARPVAELHRLLRERKGPGDERLRRDDGRERRDDHERVLRPPLDHAVEGVLHLAPREKEGALPEIVEEQRRKDDRVP